MWFALILRSIITLQKIINHIKDRSHSATYASFMSPPVVMQVISSMKIIMGEDGTDKGECHVRKMRGTFCR